MDCPTFTPPGAENTFSLVKDPDYIHRPLDQKTPEQVAFMLIEAMDYFGLGFDPTPQVPFDHGHGRATLRQDENAVSAYLAAVHMLRDMAQGKPRAVKTGWSELIGLFRSAENKAVDAYREQEREVVYSSKRAMRAKSRVYFIGAPGGAVKIGKAVNPAKRMKELQTGHNAKLAVLATTPGGLDLEAEYHRQFAEHRLHGEWFQRCPEIEAEIVRLNSEGAV